MSPTTAAMCGAIRDDHRQAYLVEKAPPANGCQNHRRPDAASRRPISECEGHMTTYIALLRGINVGGKNKVAMADLREFLARPRTRGRRKHCCRAAMSCSAVKARPRARSRPSWKRRRPRAWEWRPTIWSAVRPNGRTSSPPIRFPSEAESDPSHLVVMFLKSAPTSSTVKKVQASIQGREVAQEPRPRTLSRLSGRDRNLETHRRVDRATTRPPRNRAKLEYGPQAFALAQTLALRGFWNMRALLPTQACWNRHGRCSQGVRTLFRLVFRRKAQKRRRRAGPMHRGKANILVRR